MTFTWQDGLVLSIVLGAAAYAIRQVLRVSRLRRRPGCGACRPCNAQTDRRQVIQITPPPKP